MGESSINKSWLNHIGHVIVLTGADFRLRVFAFDRLLLALLFPTQYNVLHTPFVKRFHKMHVLSPLRTVILHCSSLSLAFFQRLHFTLIKYFLFPARSEVRIGCGFLLKACSYFGNSFHRTF